MVRIEFSLAISLYLIITICVILAAWIICEKKKTLELFSSEKNFFWQCDICTYVYVDSRHAAISTCPRCGSYNKKADS
ncbi:MAG: hypothetical protein P9L93_07350 [Candidatus Gorgyraea atricola]|nr:hypothetical protein [Candidatus Gorgyraea atricola]